MSYGSNYSSKGWASIYLNLDITWQESMTPFISQARKYTCELVFPFTPLIIKSVLSQMKI